MDTYEINSETLLIVPNGSGKSKVYELDEEFEVNMSPLSIIKNSCLYFGSTYEGRCEAIKKIIGTEMKIPIIIEDSRNIIFFPTTSCIKNNSVWISYQNLIKYKKTEDLFTLLYFKNGKKIRIDVNYNLVDNQVIRCIKLDSLLIKRKMILKKEVIHHN